MSEMKHPGLAETVGRWDEAQQHLAWKVVQTHERSIEILSAEILRREHPRCERLTDEERSALDSGMCQGGMKALRIIDAHAAYRAALVAQLEAELTRQLDEARAAKEWQLFEHKAQRLESEVARLTREREEAQESAVNNSRCLEQSIQREEVTEQALRASQANAGVWFDRAHAAESQVTRLTEALAAAETARDDKAIAFDLAAARAAAAEARVRELESELSKEVELRTHWFKAFDQQASRVRELEEANACVADYQDALLKAESLATEWKQNAEGYRLELQVLRTEHEKILARFPRG